MAKELRTIEKVTLKLIAVLAFGAPALAGITWSRGQNLVKADVTQNTPAPITLPLDYRDWKLVSVAHEAGKLNDLRAVLGNDLAIDAYRDGATSFPDGAIIARLAWTYTPSEENNKAFGQEQSFVAGTPTNVQLMVKDTKRFASTGGWGYAQFTDGKPAAIDPVKSCYSCHTPAKQHDYVFTHYAH
ncbi:cytochrome P460 family protein [Terriglobus sp. ADX1]|uniref:cytochrome P460 family protein n=1 Tax=Terriglobus sp. ADX1 TaxID=2794063 RepID=UPI002FE57627